MSRTKIEDRRTSSSLPDFDEMVTLALSNPEAFEEVRRQHIESFLNTVPQEKRQRLAGLQWKIDQIRNLANTPMAACIKISNMMRDSLNRLNSEQIKLLNLGIQPMVENQEPKPHNATILQFTRH